MEVADALYGTSMRSGITEVISQRLRDADLAGAVA
jgi:chromosome segregation ATPase